LKKKEGDEMTQKNTGNYRIAWQSTCTKKKGHGDYVFHSREDAQAKVSYLNKEFPFIQHWVEKNEKENKMKEKEINIYTEEDRLRSFMDWEIDEGMKYHPWDELYNQVDESYLWNEVKGTPFEYLVEGEEEEDDIDEMEIMRDEAWNMLRQDRIRGLKRLI
jgi:hypothetical protein